MSGKGSDVRAVGAQRVWAQSAAGGFDSFDTASDVLPAIEAGAIGYLLKDTSAAELKDGVRSAYAGPCLRPVSRDG